MRNTQDFAYIRVSTRSQSYARQLELLKSRIPDILENNIFSEKKSGATTKGRTELKRLLETVRQGDTIYVHSIDRLGRCLMDILQILKVLEDKGVRLVSISQNIDSDTPTGRMFMLMCGMLGEIELMLIQERTKEGVSIAKRNKKMGRPRKELSGAETTVLVDYIEGRKTASDCMELLKISRATFFRRLQEFKDKRTLENDKADTERFKNSLVEVNEEESDTIENFDLAN